MNGSDWEGMDASNVSWVCLTGKQQSPIDVVTSVSIPVSKAHVSSLAFGSVNVSSANGVTSTIINTGESAKLVWNPPSALLSNFTVSPSNGTNDSLTTWLDVDTKDSVEVAPIPLQLHIHSPSEHLIDGRTFAAEVHIVSKTTDLPACKKSGCLTVVGIMFDVGTNETEDNPWLSTFLPYLPKREGANFSLPEGTVIDIGALTQNGTYYTYAGSLTTPPCSEGVLWHVLLEPQPISMSQLAELQLVFGDNNCSVVESGKGHNRRLMSGDDSETWNCTKLPGGHNARKVQPLNGRSIKEYLDTAAAAAAVNSTSPPQAPSTSGALDGGYNVGTTILFTAAFIAALAMGIA